MCAAVAKQLFIASSVCTMLRGQFMEVNFSAISGVQSYPW